MTYEANIAAYGTSLASILILVPHDIDWVKDRVRWYWENKFVKRKRATVDSSSSTVTEEKTEESTKEASTST
jgi:hypothetical protein